MATPNEPTWTESLRTVIYKIEKELPDKRCIIAGNFADLPIDKEVIVTDGAGVLYAGVVVTRSTCGVIVKVYEVLVD